MSLTQSLDHLILFVPVNPDTKLPHLPSFFEKNFVLTPGGVHADGITSNTLIVLADGCYIELISFITNDRVASHWWGPNANYVGWKDWCLTNSKSPEENHEDVKDTHAEPIHGGRKRADGVDVKWAVTFPQGQNGGQDSRGRIPFFCHDVTERSIRVPLSAKQTEHPCGALGVKQLTIVVKDQDLLEKTRHAYALILDDAGPGTGEEVRFQAGRVSNGSGLQGGAHIVLRLPKNEQELEATNKNGYCYGDVVLGAKAGAGKSHGTREQLDEAEGNVKGLWLENV
jgi:hypothetical protein